MRHTDASRPAVTLATFAASADQETARRFQQLSARIEDLERNVVRLTAELRQVRQQLQPAASPAAEPR